MTMNAFPSLTRWSRTLFRVILVLGTIGFIGRAKADAADAPPDVSRETFRTSDGWTIYASYYKAYKTDKLRTDLSERAVVVLLHGEEGNRVGWDKSSAPPGKPSFPVLLHTLGYAVLTVDLRKHGESVVKGREESLQGADWGRMMADLVAVKEFIFAEHQEKRLNMNKLGIIACDKSAPLAAAFAEYDWKQPPHDDSPLAANRTPRGQDVKFLGLISPESSAGGLQGSRSLGYFSKIPDLSLLVCIGTKDPKDKKHAETLFQTISSKKVNEDRVLLLKPELKDRGLDVMGKAINEVEVPMVKFMETHLLQLECPWQDRRSRLIR